MQRLAVTATTFWVLICITRCPCAHSAWAFWPSSEMSTTPTSEDRSGQPMELAVTFFDPGPQVQPAIESSATALINELETTQDKCLLRAFANLKADCTNLSSDQRARLAVKWLNCLRVTARLPGIVCSSWEPLATCLEHMDKDDFTQYSMYLLKLIDVCAYLSNDLFRAQVKSSVQSLQTAVTEAKSFASDMNAQLHDVRAELLKHELRYQHGFETLANNTATTLHKVAAAHGNLEQRVDGITRQLATHLNQAREQLHDLTIDLITQQHAMLNPVASMLLHLNESVGDLSQSLAHTAAQLVTQANQADIALKQIQRTQTALIREQEHQVSLLTDVEGSIGRIHEHTTDLGGLVHTLSTIAASVVRVAIIVLGALATNAATDLLCIIVGLPWPLWSVRAIVVVGALAELAGPLLSDRHPLALPSSWTLIAVRCLLGITFSLCIITALAGRSAQSNDEKSRPEVCEAESAFSHLSSESAVPSALLIDYIVALRAQFSSLPPPESLMLMLTAPPPNYRLVRDDDGDETLAPI